MFQLGRRTVSTALAMALGVGALAAQTGGPADFETDRVAYRLSMPDPSSHLFTVTIEVDFSGEVPGTVDFQIPMWSPGLGLVDALAKAAQRAENEGGPASRPYRRESSQAR